MIHYELHKTQAFNDCCGQYETFGITVFDRGQIICAIEDISLDRDKVKTLVDRFNREHLSPAQLEEAVENFLYDFEV